MEKETDDTEIIATLRSEIGEWRPRQVPNLVDVANSAEYLWQRPIALASAMGAAGLAVLLLLSVLLVVLAPPIPGGDVIRSHLLAR